MAVDLSWRSRLTGEEAGEVRALLDAATAVDGMPPVSEAVRLRLRPRTGAEREHDQTPAVHLLAFAASAETSNTDDRTGGHARGKRLVGYAHLGWGDGDANATGELAVLPQARRRGVGGELVRALLDRAGGTLRVWAHGEHPAAARLARRYGFAPVRTLVRMRRSLLEPPLPTPRWPEGVRLRPFVVGRDEAAFVKVNNKAFAWHPEQGHWDVEQVRLREAEPWFDAKGFLLAVASGTSGREATDTTDATATDDPATERIVGFHWTKAHSAEMGEVYVLGVDPDEHGRGLGTALTLAGLHHLRARGMSTVMLYTEVDNISAVRTYERLGFSQWDMDVVYAASSH
jgi:mycothiol synthase